MPVSKKPKRKHNSRRSMDLATRMAMKFMSRMPLESEHKQNMAITYHVAYEMINLSVAMSYDGLGEEYFDDLAKATDAMNRAKKRVLDGKGMGLDGDGLAAVERAIAIHEAQLDSASMADVKEALTTVDRVVAAMGSEPQAKKRIYQL